MPRSEIAQQSSYLSFSSATLRMWDNCVLSKSTGAVCENSSTHKSWRANLSQAPPHAFQWRVLGLKATKGWAKPQGEEALSPLRPPHCLFTQKSHPWRKRKKTPWGNTHRSICRGGSNSWQSMDCPRSFHFELISTSLFTSASKQIFCLLNWTICLWSCYLCFNTHAVF